MLERPTAVWRERVAAERAALAAGALDPDDAFATELWPDRMIWDTEEVFDRFEADAASLAARRAEVASDTEVSEVIRRTVLDLNDVDARHGGRFETSEREQLCEYIENILERAGIDVDALSVRHRMTRHEITDEWREW